MAAMQAIGTAQHLARAPRAAADGRRLMERQALRIAPGPSITWRGRGERRRHAGEGSGLLEVSLLVLGATRRRRWKTVRCRRRVVDQAKGTPHKVNP